MRAFLIILCFLLSPMTLAQSPAPPNPYEGRVAVGDQSIPSRDRGLRDALSQVIARISGDAALVQAAPLIARAPQTVQRYSYERTPEQSLELVAAFDGRVLESQLRGLGLPIWGVAAAPPEDVRISVENIASAHDYARVLNLLRGLPGVRSVQVEGTVGDRIELRLRADGGSRRLSGALFANGTLSPATAATAVDLAYRLP
jgi:hypothetical protein